MDFTGETCTNCKYNENNVFPQQPISEWLDQVRARATLHRLGARQGYTRPTPAIEAPTEEAGPMASSRSRLSRTNRLPLYAILLPTANGKVKVLGVYDEGKINQPDRFAAWLKEVLEKAKK